MTSVQRTGVAVASFSGLALTLGLAYAVAPGCIHMCGLTPYCQDAPRFDDEGDELDTQRERLHREIEFGDHLAVQLAAGSITLACATAQIEPRMRTRPHFEYVCESYYRAPNLHLGTARYLIGKAQRLLEDEPIWQVFASARLEAEYAVMR